MMKKYWTLIAISIFYFESSYSQGGEWTWISGDTNLFALPAFGTQGVPSIYNHPAADYESVEWKDKEGNFWVYSGSYQQYNDLWKFNPVTLEWTWVKGNGVFYQAPVYGTLGVSDPGNTPGERCFGSTTWTDTSGNLWLFGGYNIASSYGDLWKYDISTNEWTWMSGSQTPDASGIHGVKGIPNTGNMPGSRTEACASWTDSLNNLWLLGGLGFDDSGTLGLLNDLCKYDIGTNEWTWMQGSALSGAPVNYGIKGVPNANNDPGGRFSYSKWKDAQDNFWLFGGSLAGVGFSNGDDVWKYDKSINTWTWMAGTNTLNSLTSPAYQNTCIPDTINPWSRFEHRSSITDNCGKFWMFGGYDNFQDTYSDLWLFNPDDLKWNLIWGSSNLNDPGHFGSLGIQSPANRPCARFGALAWWGEDDRYYIFGGSNVGTALLGDLWVFTPYTFCVSVCSPPLIVQFNASNNICPGTCTDFTNLSYNASSYQWSFPGATPDSSTTTNPQNICYPDPGSYDVQLIATNANGSDTLLLSSYITVYPSPPPQSITQSGDTLFAIAGSASYQWYFNGNIINGATDYFYIAPANGDYNVVATDLNGCEVEAAVFNVMTELQTSAFSPLPSVFPNPVEETLTVIGTPPGTTCGISVYNVFGEIVLTADARLLTMDCHFLSPGMYLLEITTTDKTYHVKFIKH